ncbi:unnamed protein product [Brassica oleracea]
MSVTVTHMNTINHVSKTCKIPKLQLPICFNRRLAFSSPRKLYPYPQLHPKTLNGSSRFNTRKRTSVSMEWQDCIVKMKVDVPASVAYNFYLYLDPESFPKLMPFISSVEMSSIASGTVPTTKSVACFRKSASSSSLLHRSSSSRFMPTSLSPIYAKLINSNNSSSVSSSSSSSPPEPLRPVMRSREADRLEEERLRQVHWQDVAVKMVVDAPASVAYKLYADRDLFPKWMPFLSSVEAVEGSPDLSRYLVKFNSFGQNVEYHFLAKNLQPIPDRKLHWRSIEGFANRGSVRFFPRGPSLCLVEINFSFEVPHALAPVAFVRLFLHIVDDYSFFVNNLRVYFLLTFCLIIFFFMFQKLQLMKPFMEKLIRGGLERFAAFVKTS